MTNILLADMVFIFHLLIVLFVLFAPFTHIPAILILHITFSICLLLHWYSNSDVCSLTVLESHLRGMKRTDTFTHQFIGPVYNISSSNWSNIVHVITILTMFLSIYYLYNNEDFKTTMKCINNIKFDKNTTFYEKMSTYIKCIHPLFSVKM
jgi:predicted PurR-regulated permease PerM